MTKRKKHAKQKPKRKQAAKSKRKRVVRKAPKKTGNRKAKRKPLGRAKKTVRSKSSAKNNKTAPKNAKKSTRKSGQLIIKKERGKNNLEYSFKKVKAIDKKIELILSERGERIKALLSRHKLPPKMVFVLLEAIYKGEPYHASKVSPPSLALIPKNIIAWIEGIIQKMKEDFNEWVAMRKAQGLPLTIKEDDENDTDIKEYYNPDLLSKITIKFIFEK